MFKKDFLLIDIEATGIDVTRHEMIQLAAVLLDKKTLAEKGSFDSFIRPKKWEARSREAMNVNKIGWDKLRAAPTMHQVLTSFVRSFPKDIILANYGGVMDMSFLTYAFRKEKIKYPYDYHAFNLWPLFYVYMAGQKKLNDPKKVPGFSLESIAKHFKLKVGADRHDALADCRLEAQIFREVMKKSKLSNKPA